MDRAAKIATASRLRGEGLTIHAIADRMGAPPSTVSLWLSDPDGAKARARKARYTGTCVCCGGPTDGSNGRPLAPTHCWRCVGEKRRVWDREGVVDAIWNFHDRYGRPPLAGEWLAGSKGFNADAYYGDGDYPSTSTVQKVFGSFNAAVVAAGYEPHPAHRKARMG